MISLLSIYVLIAVPDPTPLWLRTFAGLIGVVLGGVFGFFRGKITPIRTGELPDTIYVGPSLAASLLWVVAFALRYWVRMSEHHTVHYGTALPFDTIPGNNCLATII